MGNTRDTGYLQNIVQYDASNNITLPANLTVTGVITGYATTSYVGTQLGGYVPTTRTISINGTSLDLSANRSFTINSMVYPGAGIAVSTGSAWGTSLTDNSSNWNTAYGWGNHAGLYSLLNHTHTFASLTSIPTTLVGYGITDAATSAQGTSADTAYGWGNHAIAGYLTGITSGQVTTALGFTPYNATNPSGYITTAALSTYATESYVGTQIANLVASSPAALDTLNELAAALGNDAAFSTTVSTALGNRLRVDINTQGLSATLQGYGRTNLGLGTAATANTGDFVAYRTFGTAANSATGDFVAYRTFGTAANNNTGDFAAASHTHSIANVTGLQTALDGKQASGSYAASSHSHIISDVTGLQTALDGKQASLGFTPYNSTNPSGYISSYTETDTLASVTGRGASTSTALSINNTLTVTNGRLTVRTGGANTYGIVSGYDNNNHMMTFRADVTGPTASPTYTAGHQMTFIEYAQAGDTTGWFFKSSSSTNYEEIARITRAGATFSGTISASNYSGTHSGSSSGTNTGDQTNISGNAATATSATSATSASSAGTVTGRQRGSFTVGGSTNTFYPVAFQIGSSSTGEQGISVLQIERGGYDEPGYSNYTFSTFHCRIRAKADGWGYGASYVQVEANAYTQPMLAEVAQQNQTSQLIVWLRGGCAYRWMDIEGSWTLNFGNPSGTSYSTYSGNAVYASTTTNSIGSNFKYQTGWGDNFISGRLTAGSANLGSITGTTRTLNVAYSIGVRANLTGTEQEIFNVGNTGSGVNDGYMRLLDSGTVKVLIGANNARSGDTYFNGGGNFGIHTDTPNAKLQVVGRSNFTSGSRTVSIGDGNYANHILCDSNVDFAFNYNNGSTGGFGFFGGTSSAKFMCSNAGTLTVSGDVIAYGSPSDARLKNIKEKVPNALDIVLKLNGYKFDWIEKDKKVYGDDKKILHIKEDIGVIAQEVAELLPELARTNEDGFMSVRYQGLTAVLIEAVKEQQTQIESQKSEIDELKDLVKQLINR